MLDIWITKAQEKQGWFADRNKFWIIEYLRVSMIRCTWEVLEKSRPESIDDVLEILLRNRGVDASFLNCSLKDLESHLAMKGMDAGAMLTARHLASGSKVVLIGDYDCDGITSLAQLVHFLKDIGYDRYAVIVPQRAEGYGVPERAIIEHSDAKLFVAVDCGTHDIKSVSAARRLGVDFLAIDHHEVSPNGMAPTTVLINPKQAECPSAFKDFCAAGLTLLFLSRLRRELDGRFPIPRLGAKYLTLAAIGTIADLVPLVDANRILAHSGLGCINMNTFAPVRKLAESAGLAGKTLNAGHVGYYLGPRINAAARMGDATLAPGFLTAEQKEEFEPLADELNSLNARRQHLEDRILSQIRSRYREACDGRRTLIVGDSEWPHGVVGIVASRIQQEFHYGPTMVFSLDDGTGEARGSARSIPGFDVYSALESCEDLLLRWGGHKMAAGMTILAEDLNEFSERIEEFARTYPAEIFFPRRKVDLDLDLKLLSPELFGMLKKLEPHGPGNPVPTFVARNVRVEVKRTFGKRIRHLQLLLDKRIEGIFWRGEQCMPNGWQNRDREDVVFQVDWNVLSRKPVLNIKGVGDVMRESQEGGGRT
jgi:single-stranded-DNA-specific exonuclease